MVVALAVYAARTNPYLCISPFQTNTILFAEHLPALLLKQNIKQTMNMPRGEAAGAVYQASRNVLRRRHAVRRLPLPRQSGSGGGVRRPERLLLTGARADADPFLPLSKKRFITDWYKHDCGVNVIPREANADRGNPYRA